jgi:hypothetical protein
MLGCLLFIGEGEVVRCERVVCVCVCVSAPVLNRFKKHHRSFDIWHLASGVLASGIWRHEASIPNESIVAHTRHFKVRRLLSCVMCGCALVLRRCSLGKPARTLVQKDICGGQGETRF